MIYKLRRNADFPETELFGTRPVFILRGLREMEKRGLARSVNRKTPIVSVSAVACNRFTVCVWLSCERIFIVHKNAKR